MMAKKPGEVKTPNEQGLVQGRTSAKEQMDWLCVSGQAARCSAQAGEDQVQLGGASRR